MRKYIIAPMKIGLDNVIAVKLSKQYIGKDAEIQKSIEFFRNLFGLDEILIVILDENEKPFYYGNKEITDDFDNHTYKKFPWTEFEYEEK